MMRFFRENRTIIWIIGALAMSGMVLSMVGTGMNLSSFGGGLGRGTAAKVGKETITVQELMVQVNRQREQMTASMEKYLGAEGSKNKDFVNQLLKAQLRPDRILNDMVNRKLFVMTAEKNGAVATPMAIRSTLAEIPAFQKNGAFDVLTYKEVLRANNLSPGIFEKDVKEQVKVEWFRDLFLSSLASISESEKKSLEQVAKTYTFETLTVDAATFDQPKTISEDKVQEFLAAKDSLGKIEAYFNANLATYEKPEQIRVRHILIKGDKSEEKIKALRQQIVDKKITFAEAAKKNSEDPSNASKGGDLGFFGRGVMDPAFEGAAFALNTENKLSQPVKSSFGWHLIEFVDKSAATKRSLDSVKSEIAHKLALDEARQANAKVWIQGFLSKGTAPTESEAKAMGLKWQTQAAWSPMDPRLGDLGSVDEHLSDLLALSESQPFLKKALPVGNRLVLVKLKSVAAGAENSKNPAALEKAGEAFGFYLESLRKSMEASKDIQISPEALQLVQTQMERAGF